MNPAKVNPRNTRTRSLIRDLPYPLLRRPVAAELGGIYGPPRLLAPFSPPANRNRPARSPFRVNALPDGHGSETGQMKDVVEGGKNHQQQHDREPDAEAVFLCALRQRTSADRLDRIEQKVAAIEQRNREQVEEPDRDRQHRGEMDERAQEYGFR